MEAAEDSERPKDALIELLLAATASAQAATSQPATMVSDSGLFEPLYFAAVVRWLLLQDSSALPGEGEAAELGVIGELCQRCRGQVPQAAQYRNTPQVQQNLRYLYGFCCDLPRRRAMLQVGAATGFDRRGCFEEAVALGLWPSLYQRPQQLVERTPALRAAALWQPEELGLPAAAMLAELLTHWQEIAAEVTGLAAAGWRLEVLWRSRVGSV